MKWTVFWAFLALFVAAKAQINDICSSGLPVAEVVCSGGEIPGIAGVDYPIFSQVPPTNFRCDAIGVPGYYADTQAACQVFYICERQGKGTGFLCPNGTLFNQETLVCDWWNHVDCSQAVKFYSVNQQIVAEMEAANERLGVNQRERDRLAGINVFNPYYNPKFPNQINPYVNSLNGYNRFNQTFPFLNSYNNPGSQFNPYRPFDRTNPYYKTNFPYNQNNPFNPLNPYNRSNPYPYNPYSPNYPLNPYPYNILNSSFNNPYYNPLANQFSGPYPKNPLAYKYPYDTKNPNGYPFDPRYTDPKNPLTYKYPNAYAYDPRYPTDPKNPFYPYDPKTSGYPFDPRYYNDLKNPFGYKYPNPYDPQNKYPGQYPYDPKTPLSYPYDPRYDSKNPLVTPRPLGYQYVNPFFNPFSSTTPNPYFNPQGVTTPKPSEATPTYDEGVTNSPNGVYNQFSTPKPVYFPNSNNGYQYNRPDREYLPPI